jgi:DNA-binding MarR family transcriptional regulator
MPKTPQRRPATASDHGVDPATVLELIYFAHSALVGAAAEALAELGIGWPHRRVLFFVDSRPGISVSELLAILRVTNQGIARVLNQLIKDGLVEQVADEQDRRKRLLYLTDKGRKVERTLFQAQSKLIHAALDGEPVRDVLAVERLLRDLVPPERRHLIRRVPSPDDTE